MKIPVEFKRIVDKNPGLATTVAETINVYRQILEENKLYFFEEYTDHGIKHINSVLEFSAKLIRKSTFDVLENSPKSAAWYILAVILHDLGMHLTNEGFYQLLNGQNDEIRIAEFDKKTWKELWEDFLNNASRYNAKEKENIFGNPDWQFRVPPIENKDKLTGEDKKLIGEFIRIHHPRLAHEIAIQGFPAPGGNLSFSADLRPSERFLIGLVARSHGMDIRNTFDYVRRKYQDTWTRPYGTELFFLMAVLRIADYCQIDANRTNPVTLKLKSFRSPVSKNEHYTHEDLPYLQRSSIDPETLAFHCEPRNSYIFIKIKNLLMGLQNELDRSWAILGEVYGKDPKDEQPEIQYRRIKANIDDVDAFSENASYVPEKIHFTIAHELSKLLIAPLYGNDPSYGVRELIQNAVDSCLQRALLEKDGYEGTVKITFFKKEEQCYFRIEDNGMGMSLDTLKNYYLRAGSSYRSSAQWKHDFVGKDGKANVHRNGKFGIGVLATFLLGKKICLQTRAMNAVSGLSFETHLENEHIEITKTKKAEVGTIIEIPVEEAIIKMLETPKKNIRFDRWFVHSSPKIIYDDQLKVFKELGYHKHLPGYHDELPAGWYEFPAKEYKKVLWSYELPEFLDNVDIRSKSEDYLDLQVNGIIIPGIPKIIKQPLVVSVFDFEGKFPVNLSRNGIDGELPFKKQLIEDMVKKCFASILLNPLTAPLSIDPPGKSHKRYIADPLIGRIALLFSKTGFIVATEYFFTKNKNKPVLACELNTGVNRLALSDLENGFIDLLPSESFKDWMKVNSLKRYKAIIRINGQSHRSLYFKELALTGTPISLAELDNNTMQIVSDYEHAAFNISKQLDVIAKGIPAEKEIYIIESNLDHYPLIAPLSVINHNELKIGEIFNSIVAHYMNGVAEIPYDFEERKRLFPEAFEELKRFMNV